ncbi:amino acid/polyamine transporter I [Pyrenochaeta sp. MPI-SDFR-AT-0127]|nr:amino acid/polyamine transporter I [Pyrenochaeta sp. MPI-SDFR-AT-0127]
MDKATQKHPTAPISPDLEITHSSSIDTDTFNLAQMGYTQDLSRNFSVWSVLGVGFSLTNSWIGISAGLITGIDSGGPLLIIYGIMLMASIATCVGISLSELASAMPNAGGQYFWANELAPKRFTKLTSYLTGWLAWWGSLFTSASVALAAGSAIVGCYQLGHPEFVIRPWHVFVAYQVANIFCFFLNCNGKTLPTIAKLSLWTSLLSFSIILITVPAVAPTHQHAKFVFATFINNTGWKQDGIAFIVGLVNTNWSFACLDCATHLAEEVHRPEKMIPIAIMGTVGIGFVTSWFFSLAMFFSIVNKFSAIGTSSTGVPMLQLFYQALKHKVGATILEALIIASLLGCMVACHTYQSRLCWSFARDRGLPAHNWLSKVHKGLDIPLNAHFASCFLVALLGCMYLASLTAFNSMIAACIVLLYLSYTIPVICLLIRGRSNIKPGPFWLGPVGLFANIILLLWTLFTLVMYSFPYYKPVTARNMNYVCVVYAVIACLTSIDWVFRGRKSFRGFVERKADVDAQGLTIIDILRQG